VVLDATAAVRIRPSAAMTEVSVDVSYDLETSVLYSELGLFVADDAEAVTREIHFRTDRPGIGEGEVAFCMSNGRLEAQILELAT
jgi:hypothetical protein